MRQADMRAGRWVGGWVGRSVGRSYSHSEMEQVLGENAHSLVEEDRFVSNMQLQMLGLIAAGEYG